MIHSKAEIEQLIGAKFNKDNSNKEFISKNKPNESSHILNQAGIQGNQYYNDGLQNQIISELCQFESNF